MASRTGSGKGKSGIKRPNCPWVAEFLVSPGGRRSRVLVSFVVSDKQRAAWLQNNRPAWVESNFCHIIVAKLKKDHGIVVESIDIPQISFIKFYSRAIGSRPIEEVAKEFDQVQGEVSHHGPDTVLWHGKKVDVSRNGQLF